MGRFSELQTSGLAVKTLKYKQGSVLNSDVVFMATGLNQSVFETIRQGVCAALSVAYLADVMKAKSAEIRGPLVSISAGEMTRFRRNKGISSAADTGNQKIAADLVPDQAKLAAQWAKDWRAALESVVKAHALKLNPMYRDLGPGFLKGVAGLLVEHVGGWVKYDLDVGGKSACHAVAVIRLFDGIHFFDPNIGGYRVAPERFDEFVAKYLELIKSNFGWSYRSGTLCLLNV
ncbi:MAG: hypothetical protein U1F36_10430 [Planctomycetota bacterium]